MEKTPARFQKTLAANDSFIREWGTVQLWKKERVRCWSARKFLSQAGSPMYQQQSIDLRLMSGDTPLLRTGLSLMRKEIDSAAHHE